MPLHAQVEVRLVTYMTHETPQLQHETGLVMCCRGFVSACTLQYINQSCHSCPSPVHMRSRVEALAI